MTRRARVLDAMKVAGYHDDRKAFTRLLIENRVGRDAAARAFQVGQTARDRGVPCSCFDCNRTPRA